MAYIVGEVRVFVLAVRGVVMLVLAGSLFVSARRARADFTFARATRERAETACRQEPGNVRYAMAAAAWKDASGEDGVPELRRAAALAPLDERVIQRLALSLELSGQIEEAERQFLTAARRSRKYDPRWALANFYFRRNDIVAFRKWTREALAMSYSDPSPLFDLAWEADPASGLPLEDLPDRRSVQLAYGNWLANHQRLDLASRLASRLKPGNEPEARSLAGMLAAGYRLAEAERIAPGHATRWTGAQAHWSDGAWRVHLDGEQPEEMELLSRLALAPKGPARLSWTIRTALTSPGGTLSTSGLRWRILRWPEGGGAIAESEEVSANAESGGTLDFDAPAGEEAIRIVLEYRRPRGSMRAEGPVAVPGAEVGPRP